MRFRTEIDRRPSDRKIGHDTPLVMLGSCFTDEIGARLEADGFDVLHNPFGPLYNPLSLAGCIDRAVSKRQYTEADLTAGPRGMHCLDYASRYSGVDTDALLADINATLQQLGIMLERQPVVVLTLGSAFVYELADSGRVVGNCHKFPADTFRRRLAGVDEICNRLDSTLALLQQAGIRQVLFTVSPIRHLADGLHGNTVSKSTLLLAIEHLCSARQGFCSYFPSYEIMLDDLRDYRFYASDMKHPSQVAVDYIYEVFSDVYFTPATRKAALDARRIYLAAQHRPIL